MRERRKRMIRIRETKCDRETNAREKNERVKNERWRTRRRRIRERNKDIENVEREKTERGTKRDWNEKKEEREAEVVVGREQ